MQDKTTTNMSRGRALMTTYERESIRGEHSQQRKYEAVSRVRARINDELTQDLELMAEHNEKLLDDLRELVCDN